MKNATLELMVDNMRESSDFYTTILGFTKSMVTPENDPVFLMLTNGGVNIMLYRRDAFVKEISKFEKLKLGGSVALYIEVEDITKLYKDVKDKVKIIQEFHTTDYGSTEFSMEDNNGYVLMFSQRD
ncbi:MAG TPA: VOC family protein [Candidatus Dojkabacteria bacterium]|nr:VOC family protein [Candidatus Dojkabacteria bacterium]